MRVNKKVKRLARKSVLSNKMAQGQLIVLDEFKLSSPKTKDMLGVLSSLDLLGKKITILVGNLDENVWLSARNLKNVSILQAEDASAYDLLDCEVVLFDKAGIELLNNQLS